MMLSEKEQIKYARQLVMRHFGVEGQRKLERCEGWQLQNEN